MNPSAYERFKANHPISKYDSVKEWPPELWLVEDMFLGGGRVNFVLGKDKSGKSRFTLWLAAHMLAGMSPFGLRVDKIPKRIMWILGEEHQRTMTWRLTRYAELLGADPKPWHDKMLWVQGAGMALERQDRRYELEAAILAEDVDLLVIDPFTRVHNADENGGPAMKAILNTLRHWTQAHEWDILIQHHTGKVAFDADWTQIGTWTRGTSDIAAILDSAIMLQRFGDQDSNGGSDVNILRGGRHAPDDVKWSVKDLGRSDKDMPAQTDLGWEAMEVGR